LVLYFQREAAKSYTVQWADTLEGLWTDLVSFAPVSVSGTIWFTNEIPVWIEKRFYRVLSPQRP
jgi:hypothetical protein